MLTRTIIALGLTASLASPVLAQSYSPGYGTGNIINLPLAEQTNGAQGVGATMYSAAPAGASAYAYAPRRTHAGRRRPAATR